MQLIELQFNNCNSIITIQLIVSQPYVEDKEVEHREVEGKEELENFLIAIMVACVIWELILLRIY